MWFLVRFFIIFTLCSQIFAHGLSELDKATALTANNWDFFLLGAKHMITGYDHLLFLFGVIFYLTRFKDIVKVITAFTIGHSITLIFATYYNIQANYFLIDAVIALTVMYKAFDNLDGFKKYIGIKAPNLYLMVFSFGLIHGFGLSTRLQMLPLTKHGLILKILSFNGGVEVGQIGALAIMLIFLSAWRKTSSFIKFSNVTNTALIFIGFLLLISQLHGYTHTQHSDSYPLNQDDHLHIHEKWYNSEIPSDNDSNSHSTKIDAIDSNIKSTNTKTDEIDNNTDSTNTKTDEIALEPYIVPKQKPVKKHKHHHHHGDGKMHSH